MKAEPPSNLLLKSEWEAFESDIVEGTFSEDKDDFTFCGLREGRREEDERG